jgi:hypothetical protein
VKALLEYLQERVAGAFYMTLFYSENLGESMNFLRRFTSPLAGVSIILVLFQLNQLPVLSHNESVVFIALALTSAIRGLALHIYGAVNLRWVTPSQKRIVMPGKN